MARACGLSLIELMAGMTLLAITLAITLPAMPTLLDSWRLTVAANALHHDLQAARQQALRHRQFVIMCPSQDGRSCSGQSYWQHGWIIQNEQGDTLLQRGPRPTVTIHSGGRQQARFRPNGSASGSNLTLRLSVLQAPDDGADADTRVVLSNTGRSRVEHHR